MNTTARVEHSDAKQGQTSPTQSSAAEPSPETLSRGVVQDAAWSKVSGIEELLPNSEDPGERPARRQRWYRPSLVG